MLEISRSSKESSVAEKQVDGRMFKLFINTSGMRSVMVEIEPGSSHAGKREHKGEEFKYVLNGQVEFFVGDKKYTLGPGDWLWHDSTVPHSATNIGNDTCKYITVVSLPQ